MTAERLLLVLVLIILASSLSQAPVETSVDESAGASVVHGQDELGTVVLYAPIAVKLARIEQSAGTPSATSRATAAFVLVPTPTATFMLNVGPPNTVFGDCSVVTEFHRESDAEVTGRIQTMYNSLSRIAYQWFDTETPAGQGADGIIDSRRTFTYRDDWLLLEVAEFEGEESDKLRFRQTYYYDSDNLLNEVHLDVDGDGLIDKIDEYSHDEEGRVLRIRNAGRTDEWTYDSAGRRLTQYTSIGSDGVMDYGYHYSWNEDDLIVSVGYDSDGDGEVDAWATRRYDDARRLIFAETVLGEWSYKYSERGWPVEVTLHKRGAWESTIDYEYDSLGRIIRETFIDHVGDRYFTEFANSCP